jgi:hypothetical protein
MVIVMRACVACRDREVSVFGSYSDMNANRSAIGAYIKGEEFREPFDSHDPLYMYILSTRID